MIRSRIAPLIVLAASLAGLPRTTYAQSQTPASNPLLDICSNMLAQGAGGVSGNHDKLCNCLVHETSTRLTKSEMVAYSQASAGGRAPPPTVMDKVTKIAAYCLNQAR